MDQARGDCRSAGSCCEEAPSVITRGERPQTRPFPPHAVDRSDVSMAVDEATVEEAASGIINLARAQFRQPNLINYHPHPYVTNIGPTAAPRNITDPYSAVVHLSIVKAKPSFTEPWKSMPLVSLTGTGVIISFNWSEHGTDDEGKNFERGEGGAYSIENTHGNDLGRAENNTVHVLTTAHLVQYATSIRAQIQTCSMSVKCIVECISFGTDLALLKLDLGEVTSNWKQFAMPLTRNLPRLGEEMTYLRYVKQHYFGRLVAPLQSSSRRVELNVCRGTVSGYSADEHEHHILRMKLNSSVPSYCGGALVIDCNSNIVGIISSSSQGESTGFHSVIPSVVIDSFLKRIHIPPRELVSSYSSTCTHTDGECSAGASLDTQDDKHYAEGESEAQIGYGLGVHNSTNGSKYIHGVPSLGISGFQPLENKSQRKTLGLEEGAEFVDGCGVRILGVGINHPSLEANENQSQCKEDRSRTFALRSDDVLLAVDGEPIRHDGTVRLSPGRENERIDFRWLVAKRSVGSRVKLSVSRQGKRIEVHLTLSAPKYLVPRFDEGEGEGAPSYLICGGCVFVPLTMAWLAETIERQKALYGNHAVAELGFRRYFQEQRDRDQQVIILSHVLADDVNVGYHSFENMVLSSVDGKRPINIADLCNTLIKRESGQAIEFRCSHPQFERSKIGEHSNSPWSLESACLSILCIIPLIN
jgi:hypothetical protein